MITGINTDIKYNGTTYHVQTEEKHPLIETLVYKGGAILKKNSYDYIKKFGLKLSDQQIRKLVENYHREMLVMIKNGKLVEENSTQINGEINSVVPKSNTLDELLIRYLKSINK